MNNWSTFCKVVNSRKYKNEAEFEEFFKKALIEIFGWGEEEITQQEYIHYGHASKRMDLALIYQGHHSIVIELKSSNIKLDSGDSVEQVSSYMNQALAKFGILASSEQLWVFYKTTNDYEQPKCILTLELGEDEEDGQRLGSLLSRDNYDEKKMIDFCEEKLYFQRIKDLRDLLASGRGKDILLEAFMSLENNVHDKKWHEALSKVSIRLVSADDKPNEISDDDSDELKTLLSENSRSVILKALSKSQADGEYYTDEIRKKALSGLKLVKWSVAIPTVANDKGIRKGRAKKPTSIDITPEALQMIDEKIKGLIKLYLDWCKRDEYIQSFIEACERDTEWANKNILNPEVLKRIPADKFKTWLQYEARPNLTRWRDGNVHRRAYEAFKIGNDIEGNKAKLINNINFIRNTPDEDRFKIAGELLDKQGDRYIKDWGPEAWLSLLAYQFPNRVPRLNEETRNFFNFIGLPLGTKNSESKKYLEEIARQLDFIYNCYCRWSKMSSEHPLSLFECDCLSTFAIREPEGQRYLNEHFGTNLEIKTISIKKVI